MTLAEQNTLSANETFQAKVRGALVEAAVAVMAEDTSTTGHAIRKAYAVAALGNPVDAGKLMTYGVCTNASIAADGSATDNDIKFTVNSMFNAYAGV